MKLSLEWLRKYVDIPAVPPHEIAHKLTMATAEVESVDVLTRTVKGILVGEVAAMEPIETGEPGKSMQYVTVSTGSTTYKTVCGAPNVRIGMKSAFAMPGTVIAGGVPVREQKVYGCESHGILCSPRELGWGESHAGILAFPDNMTPGTDLADCVPPDDHIIDIDNKTITHRPDLWGHYGFARELAAIFRRELKPLAIADASEWKSIEPFPLKVEDFESCPGYCCLDIDGLKAAYSPLQIQYLLLAVGLRPINLLVDLTNFIMCELGQPMHAFDGKRVRDIIVRPFGKEGTFTTLDSIERAMIPEDLMICDHAGSIALAGIMGGENTEIQEDTSRVLLESANFNPARIRRTALRLALRTDTSIRFEKGQPPYNMGLSIKRFVHMLHDAGQKLVIRSRLTCAGDTGEQERPLTMSIGMINRTTGMDIPPDRIMEILTSLGFGCEQQDGSLKVAIPPHRSKRDISIPNDIIEEIARIYGYDNIAPSMPFVEINPYMFNEKLRVQHKIRRFLSSAKGFTEVYTYSWYDNTWLKRIGYETGNTLQLKNPASDTNTTLRLELLPNLLMLAETNSQYYDRFSLYEIGNVYSPSPDGCIQVLHCAGAAYQSEKIGKLQDMFLIVKGTVEDIFTLSNSGKPVFELVEKPEKPWHDTTSTMNIILGGRLVGHIGYLTGNIREVYEKGALLVWFELDIDALTGPAYPSVTYEAIPIYPGSWMDFSLLIDNSLSYNELVDVLHRFSHPIVRRFKFLYLYDGKGLPEGKVSCTFRYWLGLNERTLTGVDLALFHTAFVEFLEHNNLCLR